MGLSDGNRFGVSEFGGDAIMKTKHDFGILIRHPARLPLDRETRPGIARGFAVHRGGNFRASS